MAKKIDNRLTQREFFLLCEEIRNKREQIERECTNAEQVAKLCGPAIGRTVAHTTAGEALQLVGVTLATPRTGGQRLAHKRSVWRVVVQALVGLYAKLGEEVPAELQATFDRLAQDEAQANGKAEPMPAAAQAILDTVDAAPALQPEKQLGIPVNGLPKTHNMRIVPVQKRK